MLLNYDNFTFSLDCIGYSFGVRHSAFQITNKLCDCFGLAWPTISPFGIGGLWTIVHSIIMFPIKTNRIFSLYIISRIAVHLHANEIYIKSERCTLDEHVRTAYPCTVIIVCVCVCIRSYQNSTIAYVQCALRIQPNNLMKNKNIQQKMKLRI